MKVNEKKSRKEHKKTVSKSSGTKPVRNKKTVEDKDLGEDLTMNEEADALKKLSPDEEL